MQEILNRAMPILSRLERAGYEGYLVGGAVRDFILNREIHDIDITTSAPVDAMQKIFADCKTIETGIRYGTLCVICQGEAFEVTQFRCDGAYENHRHPAKVSPSSSLEEDLSRRDFTINAMALGKQGLIDPFGGENDLKHGILRAVGNPLLRFEEDALRILRALRFCAQLPLEIEQETANAIHQCRNLLSHLAKERICAEVSRLVCGEYAPSVLLSFSDIMAEIFPPLAPCIGFSQASEFHCYDVYTHSVKTLAACPCDNLSLRLAALLHDIGKPATFCPQSGDNSTFPNHAKVGADMAQDALRALRFDRKTILHVHRFIESHSQIIYLTQEEIPTLLVQHGVQGTLSLFAHARADNLAKRQDKVPPPEIWDARIQDIYRRIEQNLPLGLADLAVTGADLLALGLQGSEISAALHKLFHMVYLKNIANEKAALLNFLMHT